MKLPHMEFTILNYELEITPLEIRLAIPTTTGLSLQFQGSILKIKM